jgi:hypothetical protein
MNQTDLRPCVVSRAIVDDDNLANERLREKPFD